MFVDSHCHLSFPELHGRIDAAISNNGPFVSEPYIAYRNMAITLCHRHLQPKHIAELGQQLQQQGKLS